MGPTIIKNHIFKIRSIISIQGLERRPADGNMEYSVVEKFFQFQPSNPRSLITYNIYSKVAFHSLVTFQFSHHFADDN